MWVLKLILWADSKWTVLCLTVSQWHFHFFFVLFFFCAVQTWEARVFIFSERMDVVCVTHVCFTKPPPPLKMHNAPSLLIHVCTLPLALLLFFSFSFSCNLCLALKSVVISHILSYRGILYKAASLYACSSPKTIMRPLNSLLWYMYVNISSVEHCSPITSITICRITNKCE